MFKNINLSSRKLDILFITLIVFFSFVLRIYRINDIPVNLTGDESWDLSNVYRMVFNPHFYPLTLLGDGSVSALVFYPVGLMIKLFGITNSLIYLRLNIIIYSILALVPFYLILKKYSSNVISFLVTLMLCANYVYLNFSRTAWVNVMSIFSGLSTIYFLEEAIERNKKSFFLLAGIFAGLGIYGYHFGRILLLPIIVYLFFRLFKTRFNKDLVRGSLIFFITLLLVSIPFLFSVSKDAGFSVMSRPSATYVFSKEYMKTTGENIETLFINQTAQALRGFVLLDRSSMSNGIENSRYTPYKTSPVNIVIQVSFFLGLFFMFKRKYLIWWLIILVILITQIISALPPNYSRGIFYLPVIYLVVGVFIYNILKLIRSRFKVNNNYLNLGLALVCFLIIILDAQTYFFWMGQRYEYAARQPGIDYMEFSKWQNYQIKIIKKGGLPIVNQEWYRVRNQVE